MNIFTTLAQSQDIANSVIAKVRAKGYLEAADLPSYTVKKQETAETGYSATYQLFSIVGTGLDAVETAVGEKINIPRDMVVSGGEVKTVTVADEPYQGAVVGDKYIDLTIANAQADHLYIPVNDLVDVYTGGNGIDVTSGVIRVVVDSANARGLSVGANGLALAAAVASVSGVGGSDGAMSAADKEKLDNADVTAYTSGNGIDVTSHAISGVVDANNANGLSVGANGFSMALAQSATDDGQGTTTPATAGAMSANDKDKLDNIRVATTQEVTDAIANLDNL